MIIPFQCKAFSTFHGLSLEPKFIKSRSSLPWQERQRSMVHWSSKMFSSDFSLLLFSLSLCSTLISTLYPSHTLHCSPQSLKVNLCYKLSSSYASLTYSSDVFLGSSLLFPNHIFPLSHSHIEPGEKNLRLLANLLIPLLQ